VLTTLKIERFRTRVARYLKLYFCFAQFFAQERALNGGPAFKFTEAVSFVINRDTQEEIDYYWEKLTAGGGKEEQCGWVADKYGLFWQVTPAKFFAEWVKDPGGLQRVTHEVWQMMKLDLAKVEKAFAGK